jgi:hypothetical protein
VSDKYDGWQSSIDQIVQAALRLAAERAANDGAAAARVGKHEVDLERAVFAHARQFGAGETAS